MTETLTLTINDMSCAGCAARVERALSGVSGVSQVSIDLPLGTGRVVFDPERTNGAALAGTVTSAGYPTEVNEHETLGASERSKEKEDKLRSSTILAFLLTLPVFLLEMGGHLFPAFHHWVHTNIGQTPSWLLQFALITGVLAGPGRQFFTKGVPALLNTRPDMNSLVAVGTSAAWIYSSLAVFAPAIFPEGTRAVYFESAGVIVTLILLGRFLEARATGKTGAAIEHLLDLNVPEATVKVGETFEVRPVPEIIVGDILQLKSGERIALDGTVLDGHSFVDEALLTGEPMPVEKAAGDKLIGGTINGNGTLIYRADAIGKDTVLSQVIEMVRSAQSAKLPIQTLVNQITLIFVPVIFALAILTFLIWLAFGPDPSLPFAFVASTSVLIIACPCAMGLATPLSITVGTGRAAQFGIFFRQGQALQKLQDIKAVAFDKTGTLTEGAPVVTDVLARGDWDEKAIIDLAAAVEQGSDHPIAKAILAAQKDKATSPVTDFRTIPGVGVSAIVDGRMVRLLSERAATNFEESRSLFEAAQKGSETGATPVFVEIDGECASVILVQDALKPEAPQAVSALKALGFSLSMVTGDKLDTAKHFARQLGIDRLKAEVDPAGKVQAIKETKDLNGPTCFVGDGINDSPVLAQADIGIALGTGTDVAVEAADVVLMSGDLNNIERAFKLSGATMRNIKQNLIWAFSYNVALIPVAAGVLYPFGGPLLSPMLAAGAMALSSVFVVSNALRLRTVYL